MKENAMIQADDGMKHLQKFDFTTDYLFAPNT